MFTPAHESMVTLSFPRPCCVPMGIEEQCGSVGEISRGSLVWTLAWNTTVATGFPDTCVAVAMNVYPPCVGGPGGFGASLGAAGWYGFVSPVVVVLMAAHALTRRLRNFVFSKKIFVGNKCGVVEFCLFY
jgi:hypothetical protein